MKRTTLWIEPSVHKRLRVLAAVHGVPIGRVIAGLLAVHETAKMVADGQLKAGALDGISRQFSDAPNPWDDGI